MIFTPKMPKISYLNTNNSERKMGGSATQIDECTIYDFKSYIRNFDS